MSEPNGSTGLRERIVEAATRLFAAQGYSGTSVRELVEASGCTRPSLYYYFDSKEMLFAELVAHHLQQMERILRDWQERDGALRERTHEAVDRFLDYAHAHPDELRLLRRLDAGLDPHPPQINFASARELHLQLMSETMQQGISAGELRHGVRAEDCAMVLLGALDFQLQAALDTGRWDRGRMHRTLDLVFDGIMA
jgi:AcrR family transcriptional regulator